MSDDFVNVECLYPCQAIIVTVCGRQSVVVVCISVWLEACCNNVYVCDSVVTMCMSVWQCCDGVYVCGRLSVVTVCMSMWQCCDSCVCGSVVTVVVSVAVL